MASYVTVYILLRTKNITISDSYLGFLTLSALGNDVLQLCFLLLNVN